MHKVEKSNKFCIVLSQSLQFIIYICTIQKFLRGKYINNKCSKFLFQFKYQIFSIIKYNFQFMNSQYSQIYYMYVPTQNPSNYFYQNPQPTQPNFYPWTQFPIYSHYTYNPINFSIENHDILSSLDRNSQVPQKINEYNYEFKSSDEKNLDNSVLVEKTSGELDTHSRINSQNISIKFVKTKNNLSKFIQKPKYKQSQTRNILTNVGSKVITFIQKKSKSKELVKRLYPEWSQQKLDIFYEYTLNLKKKLGKYLTIQKIREFWNGKDGQCDQEIQMAIRRISYKYLTQKFILETLNSKRIRKNFRINHLQMKSVLLKQLKQK